MLQGINPKLMKQAMKRMGIKQEEIDASEVIIKTSGKDIIIRNPHVAKVNMAGQETFQISGDVTESSGVSAEDIKTVAQQADVSEEEAKRALEEADGDLAKAILNLQS
ncbi:MAG: nascent polypeptide-associated complex protein [archaeon]